jgi:hypothetical protein
MKLEEEMVHTACAHFDRYGGSFNRTLAHLWRIADSENKKILMNAYAPLFMQGFEQAMDYKEWKRQQQENA